MHTTIRYDAIKIYPTHEMAATEANHLQELDEDGWTYDLEPHGDTGKFKIAIHDEDGYHVNYWG